MSAVTAAANAARKELARVLFARSCTRKDAANGWVTAGAFPCHYEEAGPTTTGLTGVEGGNAGYGVNVFCPVDQALNSQDRIVVDGLTLEVQRVADVGTADGAKRAYCVRR